MTDLSEYPLEKLVLFAAGVLPGFVALLVFEQAAPGSFGWFFSLPFLGYRTKLSLIVLVAFVVGNTMSAFLSSLFRWVGWIIGYTLGHLFYKPSHFHDVAPWRDPTWRGLVKSRLGTQAPNDTRLMPQEIFDLRKKMLEGLPEEQRSSALFDLVNERMDAAMDDANWARWYEHYHQLLIQPDDRDVVWHVRNGLNFNLQTASLYVLISALVVPSIRHWWCILPACMWVLDLVGEFCWLVKQFSDKWSTLPEQIKYLSGGSPSVP
jgi:hypothetical protein